MFLNQGKIWNYLKYAFGEILLVIIGILVAIQIDGWKNERSEIIAINRLYSTIETNIISDIERLENLIQTRQNTIDGSHKFMKFSKIKNKTYEDFMLTIKDFVEYNPFNEVFFHSNQSGFDALKNSGFLNKTENSKLENKLYTYYDLFIRLQIEEQNLSAFLNEMEYDLFKQNIIQEFSETARKLHSKNYDELDLKKLETIFNTPSLNACHFKMSGSEHLISYYEELTSLGNEILNEIHKTYNT